MPPFSASAFSVGQDNMTACWKHLQNKKVDKYSIQLRPHKGLARNFWVNSSNCIKLDMLVPGETYEVGVTAERGGNRSRERTIQQTLSKEIF